MSEKELSKLTLQMQQKKWLEETRNAVQVLSRSSKYIVMKTVDQKGDLFWFLGKNGAVRINRKNASTDSMSYTDQLKPQFIKWKNSKNTDKE